MTWGVNNFSWWVHVTIQAMGGRSAVFFRFKLIGFLGIMVSNLPSQPLPALPKKDLSRGDVEKLTKKSSGKIAAAFFMLRSYWFTSDRRRDYRDHRRDHHHHGCHLGGVLHGGEQH